MSTKRCNVCGWEVSVDKPGNTCPICGSHDYDTTKCHKCGRVVSGPDKVPGRPLCKECHNAEERVHMHKYLLKHNAKLDERFEAWLDKIKLVPAKYPTLTEKQWLDACVHFNGCARCHSDEIDTRGFFIARELGGRYCDWNIIPLCEKCAKIWPLTKNPFRIAERRDRTARASYEYRNGVENIVKYLEEKLDVACQFEEDSTAS